jgi:hypothetical protein
MALLAPPGWTPEIVDFARRVNAAYSASGSPRVNSAIGVSSWWRSRADNGRVGGMPNSQHLSGLAIDVPTAWSAADRFAANAQRAGLVVVFEGDHWHIQRYAVSGVRGLCCGAAAQVAKPQPSLLRRALSFFI